MKSLQSTPHTGALHPAELRSLRLVRAVLNKSAQASPICLCADKGATAKADWPSVEPAQRGAARTQIGPDELISNAGVMSPMQTCSELPR
ncbi:MAG TPA: hypothetical protein VGH81_10080 [Rudaea sp.]|jgi:hypothetical protein